MSPLEVSSGSHQALRLWLQRMLDEGQAHYDDLAQQARLSLMSLAHS